MGVGITMEGIDQNPAYYALCLESVWFPPTTSAAFDMEGWMAQWGRARCGQLTTDVDTGAFSVARSILLKETEIDRQARGSVRGPE